MFLWSWVLTYIKMPIILDRKGLSFTEGNIWGKAGIYEIVTALCQLRSHLR